MKTKHKKEKKRSRLIVIDVCMRRRNEFSAVDEGLEDRAELEEVDHEGALGERGAVGHERAAKDVAVRELEHGLAPVGDVPKLGLHRKQRRQARVHFLCATAATAAAMSACAR